MRFGRMYAGIKFGRIYASLLLLPASLTGQNIYDGPHSKEFAQYLMQTHQYQLANSEWERVLFFSPGDTLARLDLLKSYRLSQKPAEGWQKLSQWYPAGSLSRPFSLEAIQLTLIQGDYTSLQSILERSAGLSSTEKSNYKLGSWLLEGKWIDQPTKTREPSFDITTADARLLELYTKTKNVHRKSQAASVALSAVVPGLGKIYSHDWKDGLLSLLFVATNTWQSYRGFSKNGISSVTGWIFGSLAVGFYSANLFGSWKSAKSYNSKQVDLIRHETEGILFTR
ncbi:MAG: hypothetical protein D4R64_03255 [Porphyromonadaceae bacterium]|nr:MAG: hypothetical protein D4R64_03255 [Porphyromonadaceae bacterium]